MATTVMMKHPETGVIKKGFYGFSWTTFFFGGFPAIFRGEIGLGLIVVVLAMLTLGLSSLIWAFIYNKRYTLGLVEKGYAFADSEGKNGEAKAKLGIAPVKSSAVATCGK